MSLPRIVVVFNKYWEVEPALSALLSGYVRYPEKNALPWPKLDHPRPRVNPDKPGAPERARARAIFTTQRASIEVWCVSDLLDHLPDEGRWQSSTERKAERSKEILVGAPVFCCIAAGTAASGSYPSRNGSVVIGTRCFLHNSKPADANPDSKWAEGPFDTVIESTLSAADFAILTGFERRLKPEASLRLIAPPLNPAPDVGVIADFDAVALSSCNVTNYKEYDATDKATIDAFSAAAPQAVLGSLETTHGLIRALVCERFLFVSGIVDRLLRFNDDVNPRPYAQNTAVSHNIGVVLQWLLPQFERIVSK
jgi:hypothetical protein